MKLVSFACLLAVATAAPQYGYQPPPTPAPAPPPNYIAPAASSRAASVVEFVPTLRDDRIHEEDGRYNFDVETGNGIVLAQSGSPDGPNGAVVKSGMYSYLAPDGTFVEVKFVADENGYQPQSDLLPVAPEFPHPIPQFVLDQIAFAAQEDAARARAEASAPVPSLTYGGPQ